MVTSISLLWFGYLLAGCHMYPHWKFFCMSLPNLPFENGCEVLDFYHAPLSPIIWICFILLQCNNQIIRLSFPLFVLLLADVMDQIVGFSKLTISLRDEVSIAFRLGLYIFLVWYLSVIVYLNQNKGWHGFKLAWFTPVDKMALLWASWLVLLWSHTTVRSPKLINMLSCCYSVLCCFSFPL